jgi:predicted solute-binding protein
VCINAESRKSSSAICFAHEASCEYRSFLQDLRSSLKEFDGSLKIGDDALAAMSSG